MLLRLLAPSLRKHSALLRAEPSVSQRILRVLGTRLGGALDTVGVNKKLFSPNFIKYHPESHTMPEPISTLGSHSTERPHGPLPSCVGSGSPALLRRQAHVQKGSVLAAGDSVPPAASSSPPIQTCAAARGHSQAGACGLRASAPRTPGSLTGRRNSRCSCAMSNRYRFKEPGSAIAAATVRLRALQGPAPSSSSLEPSFRRASPQSRKRKLSTRNGDR